MCFSTPVFVKSYQSSSLVVYFAKELEVEKKILVIDDEEPIIYIMKELFEDLGHRVTGETDPREGEREAIEGEYDLIIVDLRMPGMDGAEVTKGILEKKEPEELNNFLHEIDSFLEEFNEEQPSLEEREGNSGNPARRERLIKELFQDTEPSLSGVIVTPSPL